MFAARCCVACPLPKLLSRGASAFVLLAAGCTSVATLSTPQDPVSRMDQSAYGMRPRAGQGHWGERLLAEAAVVPAAWMRIDVDDASAGSQVADGSGFGGRLAVGNRDQSIGLLYQGIDFSGDLGDGSVHAALADFDVRVPVQEGGGWLTLVVGGGFGLARFDSGLLGADAVTEGAAQLRILFEFTPLRGLALGLGGGGMVYGHPGETEAYGSFALASMTITF